MLDEWEGTFMYNKSHSPSSKMCCDFILGNLGPVYTMDHEVGPWKMAFFHGPSSMVWFLKKSIYKAFGPLTRRKLNVD